MPTKRYDGMYEVQSEEAPGMRCLDENRPKLGARTPASRRRRYSSANSGEIDEEMEISTGQQSPSSTRT